MAAVVDVGCRRGQIGSVGVCGPQRQLVDSLPQHDREVHSMWGCRRGIGGAGGDTWTGTCLGRQVTLVCSCNGGASASAARDERQQPVCGVLHFGRHVCELRVLMHRGSAPCRLRKQHPKACTTSATQHVCRWGRVYCVITRMRRTAGLHAHDWASTPPAVPTPGGTACEPQMGLEERN